MHEVALANRIAEIVDEQARAAGCGRVRRVRVELGALSHVEPEALSFGFQAASRGTLAEGAEMVFDRPPGTAMCMACGKTVTVTVRGGDCPECGSAQLLVSGGDELRIKDLEVE